MDVEAPEIGGICGGAGVVAAVLIYKGETFDACIYLGTGFHRALRGDHSLPVWSCRAVGNRCKRGWLNHREHQAKKFVEMCSRPIMSSSSILSKGISPSRREACIRGKKFEEVLKLPLLAKGLQQLRARVLLSIDSVYTRAGQLGHLSAHQTRILLTKPPCRNIVQRGVFFLILFPASVTHCSS